MYCKNENKNYYQDLDQDSEIFIKNAEKLNEEVKNLKNNSNNNLLNCSNKNIDYIFAYAVATTAKINNTNPVHIVQKGAGPNIQGGYMTLTNCKHKMRSSSFFQKLLCRNNNNLPLINDNVWIAYFTSKKCGQQYLYALMKVQYIFESQLDLHDWAYANNNNLLQALIIKNAEKNKLGDFYKYKNSNIQNKFDRNNYYSPCNNHGHVIYNCWKADVERYNNRPHIILVGDPNCTFLWQTPKYRINYREVQKSGHTPLFDYNIENKSHKIESIREFFLKGVK